MRRPAMLGNKGTIRDRFYLAMFSNNKLSHSIQDLNLSEYQVSS